MEIEKLLKEVKADYQKTELPSYLKNEGWSNLTYKLTSQKGSIFGLFFRNSFIFAAIIIVALGTTATVSQASNPGDILYPVKIASEEIVAKITGNPNKKIENRVEEIINLTQEDKDIEKILEKYEEDLKNANENAQKEEQKENLKQNLESLENKLKEAQAQNPNSNRLNQARELTQQAQGQVKGQKNQKENSQENRQDDHNNKKDK